MERARLIEAVLYEMQRVWGEDGLNGEPDAYAWLAEQYQITEEEDVQWQLILEYEYGDLSDDDLSDQEVMDFVEDDNTVVEFLKRILSKYKSSDATY